MTVSFFYQISYFWPWNILKTKFSEKSLKAEKTGRNVAKMLKNALGKAHSKNKKGKACLRTIEQEDIARVGAAIDQIASDIEAGVYQALISKILLSRKILKI